jgi:phospholipid transport system substrate-binding protein
MCGRRRPRALAAVLQTWSRAHSRKEREGNVGVRQHMMRILIKRLTPGALLSIACLSPALAAKEPQQVIERLNAALLDVMRNAADLGYEGRYEELEPVLEESYDFPFMIRIAVGPVWRELDEAQRERITELFTEMSIATYAARFDGYDGERFEVLGNEPAPRDTVLVHSRIVLSDDEPVELSYLLKKFNGDWRIIDVLLDDRYSELARQRAEFAAVLRSGGFPDLVTTLQRKIAQLTAES